MAEGVLIGALQEEIAGITLREPAQRANPLLIGNCVVAQRGDLFQFRQSLRRRLARYGQRLCRNRGDQQHQNIQSHVSSREEYLSIFYSLPLQKKYVRMCSSTIRTGAPTDARRSPEPA